MKAPEEGVTGYRTTLDKIFRDKERWDKERKAMIQDICDEIRAEIEDAINKQRDDMKQEMLNKLKVEIGNIINQKTTGVEKRIIEDYLKPCLDGLEKDVNEMNKSFDKFLDEFSNAVDSIEDPKLKSLLSKVVESIRIFKKW
jgi:23S rRNA maturation-related 3'-5' exoribonuclease YhaM